jgi:hypothetical protein
LDHFPGIIPDLEGVVLNQSGSRVILLVLLLIPRGDVPVPVKYDKTRAGGALVNGCDKIAHANLRLRVVKKLYNKP